MISRTSVGTFKKVAVVALTIFVGGCESVREAAGIAKAYRRIGNNVLNVY